MGDAPSQSQLAEKFMSSFNLKRGELNEAIQFLSTKSGSEEINQTLTSISDQIQKLSKSLHDAILFLPSYSVKMRQNEIRDLEKALKDKEDILIPKKKFGFKSKREPVVETESQNPSGNYTKPENPDDSTPTLVAKANVDSNFITIENLKNTSLVYEEDKLNGFDVMIRDLESVILQLHGSPSTLRISNVKNCKILCGPVHTSVFVDSAFDCELFLCCQQLRTHSSKDIDVYLRVRSRAIIEDCSGIRFGPYHWDHPKSQNLHEKAEIAVDLDRFDAVDDFNWLSAEKSPNWSILPEKDRKPFPTVV